MRTVCELSLKLVSHSLLSHCVLCSRRSLDLIVVLRDGQVVEQGTHDELMRLGGLYYSMWQEQASDAYVEYDVAQKDEEVPISP